MTEPSRALVEAAKRVLQAKAAMDAATGLYMAALNHACDVTSECGPVNHYREAEEIARAELAAESAQPSGGPK